MELNLPANELSIHEQFHDTESFRYAFVVDGHSRRCLALQSALP